jgi:hypothetical protein
VALPLIVAWSAGSARAQVETYRPSQTPSKVRETTPATKDNLRDEGRSLFGGKPAVGAAAGAAAWSIVIKAYRAGEEDAIARADLARVQGEGGLPKAYLEERGEALVIAYGQYSAPLSKEAQADLKKVHGMEVVVNGASVKPFAGAFLAPPAEIKGSIPEYDLRNVRKNNGDWVLYTLQVGVYGRGDGRPGTPAEMDEFRRTAEKAVVDLRRQGEQAFYYHGPRFSCVTIGLFGKDDFDPETKFESPVLHALRQKYPYNLQNGMGIKQRLKIQNPETGKVRKIEQMQRSALMNVPKE